MADILCPTCGNKNSRHLLFDLPYGDPLMGKLVPCPTCRQEHYFDFLLKYRNKKTILFDLLKPDWNAVAAYEATHKVSNKKKAKKIRSRPKQLVSQESTNEVSSQEPIVNSGSPDSLHSSQIPLLLLDNVSKELTLSYSQVSLFQQCKFRYKAKHIDRSIRQDQKSTFYLSIGRSLHLTLANLFRPTRESVGKKEDLEQNLRAVWVSDGFHNSHEEQEWFRRCLEMLVRFVADNNPAGQSILVETEFKDGFDDLRITSRVDRIDMLGNGECRIIDYKVGDFEVPPELVIENLQWAFHYLASYRTLARLNGLKIRDIMFCYLQAGQNFTVEPTSSLVEIATKKIRQLAQEIQNSTVFPPTLNKFCGDCKLDLICPAIKELREQGVTMTEILASLK